jgi:hypothetical protein
VFCIYLRTNSDLSHLQHKQIGFYNRDEKCLQCGTEGVFKYSSLSFVFKRLIRIICGQSFAEDGNEEELTVEMGFVSASRCHNPCAMELLNRAVAKLRSI